MSREPGARLQVPNLVWLIGLAVVFAGAGIGYLVYDPNPADPHYRHAPASFSKTEPQAMVPWRDPARDVVVLFPGAATPPTDTPQVISLSRHRREIQEALGPETPLAGNALYVYPVTKNGVAQGVVILRRARGEWGAIEVVVGIKPNEEIAGIRIQRHREPHDVADYLNSPAFINDFPGKKYNHRFRLGFDSPPAPAYARTSAHAVAQAVRAVCIEYHAGTRL